MSVPRTWPLNSSVRSAARQPAYDTGIWLATTSRRGGEVSDLSTVRALVFDVFGTVVDWRGSVIRECEAVGRARGVAVDWPAFADRWRREGYVEGIARIRRGEEPWADADTLHRRKLEELLAAHGLGDLAPAEVG